MKTTIRIQNFKSLEDVTLELAPTTVFLGPNGAGKSSVLKMMKFVAMNLAEPLTSNPRITKYKFSEDLDFGSYKDIVTNNDEKRDISLELNFYYNGDSETFLNYFSGYQSWNINWEDYNRPIDPAFEEILKTVFSGTRSNTNFFFDHIKSIDFSVRVLFSKGNGNNDLKCFEITDNLSNDKLSINFNESQNKEASASASSTFFSSNRIPSAFLKELFSDIHWNTLFEQNNWMNGLELGFKFAEILATKVLDNNDRIKIFNSTLLIIINFYCIYSVCISRFLNILMIPSIRKNATVIKRNRNSYNGDDYIKYFSLLPNQKAVIKFSHAFMAEKELRNNYLASGIDIRKLGDSDPDIEIRDQYIEESNQIWEDMDYKELGLDDFKFELLQRLNHYGLGIGMYQCRQNSKSNKIMLVTQSGAEISFSQSSSGLIQLFPLLAYASNNREDYKYIAFIEQPELHLHPQLQIEMSDILFGRAYKSPNEVRNRFIIETHSEHIVRSLQLRIARNKEFIKQLKFYYFEHDERGMTKTINLEVDELGNFITPWPNGFFEESSELSFQLLEAQVKRIKGEKD